MDEQEAHTRQISFQHILTVPPSQGLLAAVADHLLYGDRQKNKKNAAGLGLSDITLLLPTKRAIGAMRDTFLARSQGRACVMPHIRALGDVDPSELSQDQTALLGADILTLPPVIKPLEREFLLAREAQKIYPQIFKDQRTGDDIQIDPVSAIKISRDLLALLDSAEIEQITLRDISQLVAAHFAENWQLSVAFLKLITQTYPDLLQEKGLIEPLKRRNEMMQLLGEELKTGKRSGRIIAAGSTGSTPATRELLRLIASHPNGTVILPGLDTYLDDETWDNIGEDHPQYAMKNLLQVCGCTRADVAQLTPLTCDQRDGSHQNETRELLISEVMRPAMHTDKWENLLQKFAGKNVEQALGGVRLITAPTQREEALVISLHLREVLESPGKTAALVTPDRQLAKRVVHEMLRWGVEINDSAGRKLSTSPKAKALLLIGACLEEQFSPVSVLALLRHPHITLDMPQAVREDMISALECHVLRGPRPPRGLNGLKKRLTTMGENQHKEKISHLINTLEKAFKPFEKYDTGRAFPCDDLCRVLLQVHKDLTRPDPDVIWTGEDGEMLANMFHEIFDAREVIADLTLSQLKNYLQTIMESQILQSSYNAHPRLYIYGLLEARLMSCDKIILGGLNEGAWPQTASTDPWLNRPMRADMGLPSPERRIGLSAHDFAQNFCAPEVVMTRAEKVDGDPTVASRWVLRLNAVLDALAEKSLQGDGAKWLSWASMMDGVHEVTPALPPRPTPPVSARPRRLSVTQIETWQRDPYAIYARHILGLKPLPEIDAEPGYGDKGTLIHKIMERYILETEGGEGSVEKLRAIGAQEFKAWEDRPSVTAFWQPRFERIAHWFVPVEQNLKRGVKKQYAEVKGKVTIKSETGDFTLRGIADRIDILNDGSARIFDYKTGALPGRNEVATFASQMPLQAYIAMSGGYDNLPPMTVSGLGYIKLSGGQEPGLIREAGEKTLGDNAVSSIDELTQKTLNGLKKRIAHFDQEETPYLTRIKPKYEDAELDYDHLSRYREWAVLQKWEDRS